MSQCQNLKNIVDPQKIFENFGADAVRVFILSDSPPEKDIQWSTKGMEACYRFIQKLWSLHYSILEIMKMDVEKINNEKIDEFVNFNLSKITQNLENFNYNVIIANLHEINNFFNLIVKDNKNYANLKSNYIKILKIMSPVIPHFASECLEQLGNNSILTWPE